jgi:hypothetical protein
MKLNSKKLDLELMNIQENIRILRNFLRDHENYDQILHFYKEDSPL